MLWCLSRNWRTQCSTSSQTQETITKLKDREQWCRPGLRNSKCTSQGKASRPHSSLKNVLAIRRIQSVLNPLAILLAAKNSKKRMKSTRALRLYNPRPTTQTQRERSQKSRKACTHRSSKWLRLKVDRMNWINKLHILSKSKPRS